MPNTKSAKKRHHQSLGRRARNRSVTSAVRTQVRKVKDLLAKGDREAAAQQARLLAKTVDQAAAKGVIHPNAAARLKSRASARLKAAAHQPAAAK